MADPTRDELNEFLTAPIDTDADDDGLPFESLSDFSSDPAGFGEMSLIMLRKVESLFDLTVVYNRHSKKYLHACALLEKGIKYLGSCCLTKIALELNKQEFPELGQLSTAKLYGMASRNFRKLDAALSEKQAEKFDLYPELTAMMFRYFNLMRRLRSTETKIYNYHIKKFFDCKEDYSPVITGTAFSDKSHNRTFPSMQSEPPAFREPPAFSILQDAALPKAAKSPASETPVSAPVIIDENTSAHDHAPVLIEEKPSENDPAPVLIEQTGTEPLHGEIINGEGHVPLLPPPPFRTLAEIQADAEREKARKNSGNFSEKPARRIGDIPAGTRMKDLPSLPPEAPRYAHIIETVLRRSDAAGDGGLTFTVDEMLDLTGDPDFRRADPEMADKMDRILIQIGHHLNSS